MAKGDNRANLAALGRIRANRPVGLTSAVVRARGNQRRRGIGAGGTFNAVGRLRNRPAGLTAARERAVRNVRRRNRAR